MQEQRGQVPEEGDAEREQAYQVAQTVDMQLAGMVETLKSLVDQVNASSSSVGGGGQGVDGGGGGDNARKIVRILNAHHHSLAWLEDSARRMITDAADVSRRMGLFSDAGALLPP